MGPRITVGVDTHLDVHVAAALDERGALLEVESFPTTPAGYRALFDWASAFGVVELFGIEGTGSYGAGLTRHILSLGVRVVEVDRPNRQRRRRRGKSDPQDAITAARAAQSGDSCGAAKTRDGNVEAIRVLRVARFSARKARTQALTRCARWCQPHPTNYARNSAISTSAGSSSGPAVTGPGTAPTSTR